MRFLYLGGLLMLRLKRPIMIASVFVVDTSDETFWCHYLGDTDTPVCITHEYHL